MPGSTQLVPIRLPPGMFRNGTEYEASGRWYDGNMIRWENGRMKPIGGWRNLLPGLPPLTGMARGGIAWEDNNGIGYLAIGTNQKLYIDQTRGPFTDYTPGMTGFNPGNATTTPTAGYGSGVYGYPGHAPPPGPGPGTGYGEAGRTSANSGGAPGLTTAAATWSFDTFGQTIVAVMTADGKLWQWDPTSPSAVVQPAGSPVNSIAVFVTNEDFVLLLGAGGQGRKIQWPDIGTTTVWTPTTTNAAGSIQLNTGGRCMAGARVGQQNLVWTDVDVHLVNFIGSPGIYGPIRLSEGCGLIGPNAYGVTDVAYWWSQGGFFRYNGIVQPMDCEVQDYIFRNTNFTQSAKIYGEVNTRYNEMTWLFPSLNSNENDSYVTYNYKMNVWSFGLQSAFGARTVWIDRGTFPLPFAVDPAGHIYEHDVGFLADGASRVGQVFVQSGPAEIGNGEQIIYSNLLLPDVDVTSSVSLTFRTRFAPMGPETLNGPVALVPNAEGYVPIRVVGRQAAVRLDMIADTDWSMGRPRLKVAAGGGR
jgi:hypothetical protein